MPPAPEFRNRLGQVGIVEVLDKMETENPAQADGHVGISGKIKIDVEHKGHRVQPVEQYALFARYPEQFRQLAQLIGKNDFLGQAHQETADTVGQIFKGRSTVFQFSGHVHIPDNGACNQLGEQRHISTEGNGVMLCRYIAPVHIHRIAHALERIEADTDGQGQPQQRSRQPSDSCKALQEKVRILKDRQQCNANDHRHRHPSFLVFCSLGLLNSQTAPIESTDGHCHQRQILRFSPTVEKQAGHQQYRIFSFLWHCEIGKQHRRQEII